MQGRVTGVWARTRAAGMVGFTVAPLFNTWMYIHCVVRPSKVVAVFSSVWLGQLADAASQRELGCERVPTSTFLFHPCKYSKAPIGTAVRKTGLKTPSEKHPHVREQHGRQILARAAGLRTGGTQERRQQVTSNPLLLLFCQWRGILFCSVLL